MQRYAVLVLDDGDLDGPSLHSPFTGLTPPAADDDPQDPSLLYDFIGETYGFSGLRDDVKAIVEAGFSPPVEPPVDPVDDVRSRAELVARLMYESAGVRSLTIVMPGGQNGVVATCWEPGRVIGGQWLPSGERYRS